MCIARKRDEIRAQFFRKTPQAIDSAFTKTSFSQATQTIALFLDSASFVFLLIISVGVVLLSGARDRESVLMLLSKTVIPIGIVIAIVSFIIFMALINDLSVIGPNLCVIMLSILYSCIAKIIIEIMISKRRQ